MTDPPRARPDERILVIKLSALGDFVLALGPCKAIRLAHPDARIVLLTTAPFVEFAGATGLFDEVWTDTRPRFPDLRGILALRRRLRAGGFARVYDLQTSDRSGWYYRLMGPGGRPEWSGIAAGCSHPHDNPRRGQMHTVERQADQLAAAGIPDVPLADLSGVEADVARFGLPARIALLVPGGAAHRPEKRWPAQSYAALGREIAARGATPVVLGGPGEKDLAAEICEICAICAGTDAVSLAGRTSIADIAVLARGACGAVGNDTGPMHIAALAGCPSVVLFSAASDPALSAPRGPDVTVLQRQNLADLPVSEVAGALRLR